MIGVIFMFASDMVEVRVEGNHVLFRSGMTPGWATIDGLQMSYDGVCKEFPDLKGDINWKAQAVERFKDKIYSYETEVEKMDYIVNDLKKHGYIPKYVQKGGRRVKRVKNDKWRESI